MSIKSILAGAVFLAVAAQSQAVPITITQTFSNVAYDDFGVEGGIAYGQAPAGDWIFSSVVDSEAVDEEAYSDIGAFRATNITLTQAALGLDAVGINNMSYLVFFPNHFAFASTVGGGAPWSRFSYEADHFLPASTLEEYLALATSPFATNPDTGFGPQWEGFELADGRRLYGYGFGSGTSSVSVADVSVPEPGTLSLMLAALGLIARRRSSRKSISL